MPIKFTESRSPSYRERTKTNIAASDATIAFAYDFNSNGEILTKTSCKSISKVYIPLDLRNLSLHENNRINRVMQMLSKVGKKELTINIAGNGIYTLKLYDQFDRNLVSTFIHKILTEIDYSYGIELVRSGGQTGIDEIGIIEANALGFNCEVFAPNGWKFRDETGKDISDEKLFKERFKV